MVPELRIIGITGIPEVKPGDNLAELICTAATRKGVGISDQDILIVTHKVVSKAEERLVPLGRVIPSPFATKLATHMDRDPRHLEVILEETKRIVRMDRGILITETEHGFVCANSGVDRSNLPGGVLALLPVDPDWSARYIREEIRELTGKEVAVIITDTFGRPWRRGLTNVAIGVAGLNPLLDYRGQKDTYGRLLQVTEMAVADELASAAELVMGKIEQIPVAIVRGYHYHPGEGATRQLVRPPADDLFR